MRFETRLYTDNMVGLYRTLLYWSKNRNILNGYGLLSWLFVIFQIINIRYMIARRRQCIAIIPRCGTSIKFVANKILEIKWSKIDYHSLVLFRSNLESRTSRTDGWNSVRAGMATQRLPWISNDISIANVWTHVSRITLLMQWSGNPLL